MNLLKMMSLVLVMSSGMMVHAEDVDTKGMSEVEKEAYYRNWRKIALLEACVKGDLRYKSENTWRKDYHHPVLQYVGPCGSIDRFVYESDAAEVRVLLRESEHRGTGQRYLIAALKWYDFKDSTDLEGKTGAAVEKIKANRFAFLNAIDNAIAWEFPKRDFNYVPAEPTGAPVWDKDRDSDEAKIAQAAKKTLHYKNPVIHRLQKLFGRKKNQS